MKEVDITDALGALSEAERGPTPEDLADAPYLNPYRLEDHGDGIQHLYGRVEGHPSIDDPYVTTSPVLAFDPDASWARTRSRWYRLGPDWQLLEPDKRGETIRVVQEYLASLRSLVIKELHANESTTAISDGQDADRRHPIQQGGKRSAPGGQRSRDTN